MYLLVFYIYSLFCGDPLAMCMCRIEKWKFIKGLRYHHAILKTVDYWLFQHEKKSWKFHVPLIYGSATIYFQFLQFWN